MMSPPSSVGRPPATPYPRRHVVVVPPYAGRWQRHRSVREDRLLRRCRCGRCRTPPATTAHALLARMRSTAAAVVSAMTVHVKHPPIVAVARGGALSVVVASPTPPPPQKERDPIVLFPLRRIKRGTKPTPTVRGGTCCLRPSSSSGCDPTTEAARIHPTRRKTRIATRRLFGIGTWRHPRNRQGGAAQHAPPPTSRSPERGI